MCMFCEPNVRGEIYGRKLAFTVHDAGIFGEFNQDLSIQRAEEGEDTYLVSGFYSSYGDGNAYVQARINYCPICGRKLGGEEWDSGR